MNRNNHNPHLLTPLRQSERIASLDVLRGFAILGILIMNIQGFSMINAAYINPTAYGDFEGINKWVWILSHVFADSKFMTIFSTLFGAGILLFSLKIESKGRKAARFHYPRIFWLLVIGMIHGYFFWYGDILVAYALCGMVVFLFRKMKPGGLLILGFASLMIPFLMNMMSGMTIGFWPAEQYHETLQSWLPAAESVQHEVQAYRNGWLERFQVRKEQTIFMQTFYFLTSQSWHSGGIMLLGMALFKWDFLTAGKSRKTYLTAMIIGMLAGFPLIITGVIQNFKNEWFFDYSMFIGRQFNYWGSLGISLAYISLVMLMCKHKVLSGIRRTLGLVGRTALSNYLFHTVTCSLIFYGSGLRLFGQVERWQQILIVLGIWALQIFLTRIWMKKFRFGPAEWAWRSLTYWKIQPIRKDQ